MTRTERDKLVSLMAQNDQFIAEQNDRVRDLAARVRRGQELMGQGESVPEFDSCVSAFADLLRGERGFLRDATIVRRVGECALRKVTGDEEDKPK